MDYKKVVKYWLKTAEHDLGVMGRLFEGKDYMESLFFAQLSLEKLLKAVVVSKTKKQAPKIHDLTRLAKLADIGTNHKVCEFLDEMTKFNLEARYPSYRLDVYKMATKTFTEVRLKKVKKFYEEYKKQISE